MSRHNDYNLALNDPALAAAVGAIGYDDFGTDPVAFAADFGGEGFGDETDMGVDLSPFAGDFGGDFGAAAAAVASARPTEQQAMAAWKALKTRQARGLQRVTKLDPNMMSDVSVERYSFSLSDDFTLGVAAAFPSTFSGTPDTDFRPQIVTANAPANGFAYLSNLKMANVDVTVGPGEEDLFGLSGPSWGRTLDMPTLTPSNRARAQGRTTTFVPPGYTPAATYTLCMNFKGPAKLAGGGAAYRHG